VNYILTDAQVRACLAGHEHAFKVIFSLHSTFIDMAAIAQKILVVGGNGFVGLFRSSGYYYQTLIQFHFRFCGVQGCSCAGYGRYQR
jgi:hypothetical protein